MKLKVCLTAFALILSCGVNAIAQTTRVAYVDIDKVTENSDRINKAMNNVAKRVEGIQEEYASKRARLTELKAEIKRGEGVLAESELKKRREESAKLEKEVVDLEYERLREMQKLDTTLFEPMLKTIVLAIEDVAKEKNIDLVLRGEAVIYGAKVADITDDVVKKLNSPAYNVETNSTDNSESSGSEEASSDESSSEKSSSSSSNEKPEASSGDSGSIIPNLPLRTRPVDRQQE